MKNTAVSLKILCCAMLLAAILAAGSACALEGGALNHFYNFEMAQPVLSIPPAEAVELNFLHLPADVAFELELAGAETSMDVVPAEDGSAKLLVAFPAAENNMEIGLWGDDMLYWSAMIETGGTEASEPVHSVVLTIDWFMFDDAVLNENGALMEGLKEISGSAAPGICVAARLTGMDSEDDSCEAVADEDGRFCIALEREISSEDTISVWAGIAGADAACCEHSYTVSTPDATGKDSLQIKGLFQKAVEAVGAGKLSSETEAALPAETPANEAPSEAVVKEIVIEAPEPQENGYIVSFENDMLVFSGSAQAGALLEWALFDAGDLAEAPEPTLAPADEKEDDKVILRTRKPKDEATAAPAPAPTPAPTASSVPATAVPGASASAAPGASATASATQAPVNKPENTPSAGKASAAPTASNTAEPEQGLVQDTPKTENEPVADKAGDAASASAAAQADMPAAGDAAAALTRRQAAPMAEYMPKRLTARHIAPASSASAYVALSASRNTAAPAMMQPQPAAEDVRIEAILEGSILVGADGSWRIEIPLEQLSEEISYRLALRYAGDEAYAEKYDFRIDCTAPAIEGLSEFILSGENLISGITEPGTKVTLMIDGGRVYRTTADKKGAFSFKLRKAEPGDVFIVSASDASGHSSEYTITVVSNTPIELSEDQYSFTGEMLVIKGTAAQNRVLILQREGIQITTVNVSDTGEWQEELNAGVFGNAADQLNFSINYKDGLPVEAVSFSVKIDVDETCALSLIPAVDMDCMVSGTTDPGASLVLEREGFADMNATADLNGAFVFELSEPLKLSDVLCVRAEDDRGNNAVRQLEILAADSVTPIEYEIRTVDGIPDEIQIAGSAMADMTLVVYVNDTAALELQSDAAGAFTADLEKLPEADNRISIRYGGGHFAHYSSAESVVAVDLTAPVLVLEQKSFNSASHTVSGTLSEDAVLSLFLNDEELSCKEYPAGDFRIEELQLAVGDILALQAGDVSGNLSAVQSYEVLEALQLVSRIDMPEAGTEMEYDQPLIIGGWIAAAEKISNLYLRISPEGGFDSKDYEDFNVEIISDLTLADQLTAGERERLNLADSVRFEFSLDLAELPVGPMTMEIIANLDGEQHVLSDTRRTVSIIKPADYLSKRVFILAVLFVLLLSMVLLLTRINRALRAVRNTVIDSNHQSGLTIKSRRDG